MSISCVYLACIKILWKFKIPLRHGVMAQNTARETCCNHSNPPPSKDCLSTRTEDISKLNKETFPANRKCSQLHNIFLLHIGPLKDFVCDNINTNTRICCHAWRVWAWTPRSRSCWIWSMRSDFFFKQIPKLLCAAGWKEGCYIFRGCLQTHSAEVSRGWWVRIHQNNVQGGSPCCAITCDNPFIILTDFITFVLKRP